MSNDSGETWRNTLEESFFAKKNTELLEKIKRDQQEEEFKQQLMENLGVEDETTLKKLIDWGLNGETLSALALFPIIQMAWSDDKMANEERIAILKNIEQSGIREGSASYQLIEEWLLHRPDSELLSIWKGYIMGLTKDLADEDKLVLKEEIVNRAKAVADADSGFLGLLHPVTEAEQAVLDELEQAFA